VSRQVLAELVEIPTSSRSLDGLYYPPARPARGVVMLLHGNTMNFYVGAPRFLPPALAPLGLGCLAFNRRGHDILSTRDSREPVGGAFQTAAEGLEDNECAAAFLRHRGFERPIVVGHSNGGMLGAAFAAGHPETAALVLLSAHVGGRGIVGLSVAAGQLAADRHEEVLTRARRLVAEGRGRELLLVPGWWYAISAESYVDRVERTPSLLEAAPRIRCPVLFVVGDQEDPAVYPARVFADAAGGPCAVVVVPACDHFYRGREQEVASVVAEWLADQVSGSDMREEKP
jgi:pimeloyl-ACP methyl ester carboxylesterase